MSIRVQRVGTRRALGRFIRLPWRIYAGDPNWVPPLIMDMKARLDRKKHPFFAHAEAEYFLAERDGEVVGRVAAVVDRSHNAAHGEKIVFFGFFESENDPEIARALLDAAAAWGRERGMDTLRGPVNLSLNDECALLIEGFDSPPAVMMPYNPRYYPDLMATAGLAKAKDLYAFFLDRGTAAAEKIRPVVERVRASGEFTIRKIDKRRALEEAHAIAAIYNDGWDKNWGFVPWTEDEMKHMVRDLIRFADPDIILFAEHRGRPVGFACGLPNFNEVLAKMNGRLLPFGWVHFLFGRRKIKGVRTPVFGLLKSYFHTGLSYLLFAEFQQAIKDKGYEWADISWELEDNDAINRFNASIGGRIYKRYRIYEKGTGGPA